MFQSAPTKNIKSEGTEPWVSLNVAGKSITFLLDTGAACSALAHSPGPLSSQTCVITVVNRHPQHYHFL